MSNPIKYSDLISPDNSISDLIKQLKELQSTQAEMMASLRREAEALSASLKNVSGATESGRKTTKSAAAEADKLARAQRDLAFAESETAQEIAKLKQAQREQEQITKLVTKRNQSAEGSYNNLSAQYSLMKIQINSMSLAERESTEAGRQLVAESKRIYDEMKRLQEATGKTSLNVGNYKAALRETMEEMARLRAEGKANTAEYEALRQEAGNMKDALMDVSAEIKGTASDTRNLDAALGVASGASSGLGLLTSSLSLAGNASDGLREAQDKLRSVTTITTGAMQLQNLVQKESSVMLGISRIQQAALTKAQAYHRLITMQGTKATKAATVAQQAYNLVASANPYVLLAVALISVVGALALFAFNTDKSARNQQRLNEAESAYLDYLDHERDVTQELSNLRTAGLNREMTLAQARNASTAELRQIEDKMMAERRNAFTKSLGYHSGEVAALESNRAQLEVLRKKLLEVEQAKARAAKKVKIDIDFDGKVEKVKVDEAVTALQGMVDNLDRRIKIGVELTEEAKDIDAEAKRLQAEREAQDREAARSERQIVQQTEDARIALIADRYEQERAMRRAATERAIGDIRYQLATESNLSYRSREALNDRIAYLEAQLSRDIETINNNEAAELLSLRRTTEDATLALMAEGAEKQRALLRVEYARQVEDLDRRLATERGLSAAHVAEISEQRGRIMEEYARRAAALEQQITIDGLEAEAQRLQLRIAAARKGSDEEMSLRLELLDNERKVALAKNRQLADDVRQNEIDINARYDAEILRQAEDFYEERAWLEFNMQQSLAESEFNLLETSERRKTEYRLKAERERLEKLLEIAQTGGKKLTAAEIKTVQNQIAAINNELAKNGPQDLYDLLGLNVSEEKKEAINTAVDEAIESLKSYMDAYVDMAAAKVEAANKDVERAKSALDIELEARAQGYANNVAMAQKELALAKKSQEEALRQEAAAQKRRAAIETLEQIGSLTTASAKIWSQLGFPWAIPAIAVMFASFAASKIMAAKQAKVETYGDGTVELLQGGSHQSGRDIDLGTRPDGTRRRAEGGEYFAVINKSNSRRYRREIPEVINALNDGTFAQKYLNAYRDAGDVVVAPAGGPPPDLRGLSSDVREIRDQNKRRTYIDGQGRVVEYYKNLKRTYRTS